MQLDETLQICLLALTSRYPNAVLDIDEDVCGVQHLGATNWAVLDLIELFAHISPRLLQTSASLVVDEQKSNLYLIARGQKVLALKIHCRGRVPASQGTVREREACAKLHQYTF